MSVYVSEHGTNQHNANIAFNSQHGNEHDSVTSSDEDRQEQEQVSLGYNELYHYVVPFIIRLKR